MVLSIPLFLKLKILNKKAILIKGEKNEIIENALKNQNHYYAFDKIENLRKRLIKSKEEITVTDLGAGSKANNNQIRKISDIAQNSLLEKYYAQFLFNLALSIKAENIIELGTSLGITTSYLASVNSKSKISSFEGCPATIEHAKFNTKLLQIKNIEFIKGNFDKTLPEYLKKQSSPDFCFIDGNHKGDKTLHYFNLLQEKSKPGSLFIFDDIRWSKDMFTAWKEIIKHPKVKSVYDMYKLGIVSF